MRPQMQAFRDALGMPNKCSLNGADIIHCKLLHIDHKEPFCNLLQRFANTQSRSAYPETIGNGETLELVDKGMRGFTNTMLSCSAVERRESREGGRSFFERLCSTKQIRTP